MEPNTLTKTAIGSFAALVLLVLTPILVLTSGTDANGQPLNGCSPTSQARPGIPEQYRNAITAAAQTSGLPAELLAAQIKAESNWNPTATSPVGARGLAQFMPATWAQYGQGKDILDGNAAIDAQGRYMKDLLEAVSSIATSDKERIDFALAAYNAGIGNVQQAGGIPPFPETISYVKRINASAQLDYSANCTPLGGSTIGELGSGQWTHPLPGSQLTSTFGFRGCIGGLSCLGDIANHRGIDFSTGGGGTVVAPADMRITVAEAGQGWKTGYGTYIIARQTEQPGLIFEFHHCVHGSLKVAPGDTVAVGTPLCLEGNTGNSAGAHLHFQIGDPKASDTEPTRLNAIDPLPILRQKGVLQ
ncbi:transglycosylase SLT domain-containing protein [Neomicrococcus lactis]|uniref:transglycosylase SLT domain-containing protein n=1 Tax=Neomicrococcus lactis TaxID=732241 RepID=UPI0023008768|nr:transglycosylase SLT domain-containing protein [Neomicrococcus lactis]